MRGSWMFGAVLAAATVGGAGPSQAAAQGTPAASAAFESTVESRLDTHPFFRTITLRKWAKHAPFVFYVQRPPKDDPEYVRRVAHSYVPYLQELLRIFEARYADPLELARNSAAPRFAIVVLNSRGFYDNYAQKMSLGGMHHVRAHYDPEMQIAVTYVDSYAVNDTRREERQAILHEVVHALQHAHSADGEMPVPIWYAEGMAEFHSTCTNVARSLQQPAIDTNHLWTLIATLSHPKIRPLFVPIDDLVASKSYADVTKLAQDSLGSVRVRPEFPLQVFYAQSAAFVEFLHRAEDGRYRGVFLQYTAAVQRGAEGGEAFHDALQAVDGADIAGLEGEFRKYVVAEARRRLNVSVPPDLATLPPGAAASTSVPAPLPPPIEYSTATLSWRDDELDDRVAAARAMCADGNYEAALDVLPDPKQLSGLARRVRFRAAEALRLRDELLQENLANTRRMAPRVEGELVGGRLVAVERDHFVLNDRGEEHRLPLTALAPGNLSNELRKQKMIRRNSWQRAWLRWLDGKSARAATRRMSKTSEAARQLLEDLTKDFDRDADDPVAALVELQRLEPAEDAASARQQLGMVRETIERYADTPLFRRRREGLRQCVISLAQRAFSVGAPDCLDIAGDVEPLDGGRVSIRYRGSDVALGDDFALHEALSDQCTAAYPKLATEGGHFRCEGKFHELVGSGVFVFPFRLRGRHKIEVRAELTGNSYFSVLACADEGPAVIEAMPNGSTYISDPGSGIRDEITSTNPVYLGQTYKIRIEHDGESMAVVSINGSKTAELTRVGTRTGGLVGLFIHGSSPVRIHSLVVEGTIDAADPLELRERFVQRVQDEIWP